MSIITALMVTYAIIGILIFLLILPNIAKRRLPHWGRLFVVSIFWLPATIVFSIQIIYEGRKINKR